MTKARKRKPDETRRNSKPTDITVATLQETISVSLEQLYEQAAREACPNTAAAYMAALHVVTPAGTLAQRAKNKRGYRTGDFVRAYLWIDELLAVVEYVPEKERPLTTGTGTSALAAGWAAGPSAFELAVKFAQQVHGVCQESLKHHFPDSIKHKYGTVYPPRDLSVGGTLTDDSIVAWRDEVVQILQTTSFPGPPPPHPLGNLLIRQRYDVSC